MRTYLATHCRGRFVSFILPSFSHLFLSASECGARNLSEVVTWRNCMSNLIGTDPVLLLLNKKSVPKCCNHDRNASEVFSG